MVGASVAHPRRARNLERTPRGWRGWLFEQKRAVVSRVCVAVRRDAGIGPSVAVDVLETLDVQRGGRRVVGDLAVVDSREYLLDAHLAEPDPGQVDEQLFFPVAIEIEHGGPACERRQRRPPRGGSGDRGHASRALAV